MSQVSGALGKLGRVLLDGLKDDLHVFELLGAGDDDGFVKMIIIPFGEDEADVLGFVSGDAFSIDKDAGVEAVFVAVKDDGAVRIFVNAFF